MKQCLQYTCLLRHIARGSALHAVYCEQNVRPKETEDAFYHIITSIAGFYIQYLYDVLCESRLIAYESLSCADDLITISPRSPFNLLEVFEALA
jgi:hypothetical protein